jgi:hypothetical protein
MHLTHIPAVIFSLLFVYIGFLLGHAIYNPKFIDKPNTTPVVEVNNECDRLQQKVQDILKHEYFQDSFYE